MVGKIDKQSSAEDKHSGDATCITFFGGYLFSGGADGKIKIWTDDLQLKKEIIAHNGYIYAMTVNSKGAIYTSSSDGSIKYFENPLHNDCSQELLINSYDDIITLFVASNDVLYSGDDKGIVTKWVDNKMDLIYNLVEEVRSMSVENKLIYTVRATDVVVTEMRDGASGRYFTIGTIPGSSPLLLVGPMCNGKRKFIMFATRDGKGIAVAQNNAGFAAVWTKENAHEMIINALCASDTISYSAGYDGKIRKWVEIENSPQNAGEANVGCCVNALCVDPDNVVYAADTNGMISKIVFSSQAA